MTTEDNRSNETPKLLDSRAWPITPSKAVYGVGNSYGISRQPTPGRSTPLEDHTRNVLAVGGDDGVIIDGLWTRPGLPMRDKRLLMFSVLARYNKEDFLSFHVAAALENDEFTLDELSEVALFLAFYAGWPVGNMFQRTVDATLEKMKALLQ
jgi:alkylhydroperoxidase/carboxymuconolactone decarboxylase family protein YurZ